MEYDYAHKTVLIVGLGLSGRSAAQFLLQKKAFVLGVDRNHAQLKSDLTVQSLLDKGMLIQSDLLPVDFEQIDLVVLSPGVPQQHALVQQALNKQIEVIGEIELGCRNFKNPILGVTGTNGKTTVTLLVTHVLNQSGFHAKALGNVGMPFTQEVEQLHANEMIVLELSSYQLETLQQRVLDGALLLNITPDHLDRYSHMQDYAKAKFRIQQCLKEDKDLIIEKRTLQQYTNLATDGIQTYGYSSELDCYTDLNSVYWFEKKVFDLPDTLKGYASHDLENLMGAFLLCAGCGVTGSQFIYAYQSFRKPSHRIEFVMEHEGVKYFDDSKGTNIDAVIRAVQTVRGSIILIAGGVDKNFPYSPWLDEFEGKVKIIFAIGEAASKIKQQLGEKIPVEIIKDLEQAVHRAVKMAIKGDSVLLSPGCASFDMFKDYAHRGDVFQKAVRSLVNGR